MYLSIYPSIYLPTYLSINLPIYLPTYAPTHLPTYQFFSHVALQMIVLIGLLGQTISLPQSFYFYLTCQ